MFLVFIYIMNSSCFLWNAMQHFVAALIHMFIGRNLVAPSFFLKFYFFGFYFFIAQNPDGIIPTFST